MLGIRFFNVENLGTYLERFLPHILSSPFDIFNSPIFSTPIFCIHNFQNYLEKESFYKKQNKVQYTNKKNRFRYKDPLFFLKVCKYHISAIVFFFIKTGKRKLRKKNLFFTILGTNNWTLILHCFLYETRGKSTRERVIEAKPRP